MNVSQELRELKMLKYYANVESLTSRLDHDVPEVRRAAAQALGEVGESESVGPLSATLSDESWYVRKQAALALGLLGDRRAVVPLLGALKDEDWRVRASAADALGQIGDRQAVQPLIALLEDERIEVQRVAAVSLGRLGDPSAIGPLSDLRFYGDPRVHDEVDEPLLALIAQEDRLQWDVDVEDATSTLLAEPDVVVAPAHRANGHDAASMDAHGPATDELVDVGSPLVVVPEQDAALEADDASVAASSVDEPAIKEAEVTAAATPLVVEAPVADEAPLEDAVRALYRHANRMIATASTDREVVTSLTTLGMPDAGALAVLRGTHATRSRSRRQSAMNTITFGGLLLVAGIVLLLLTGSALLGYGTILVGAVLLIRGLSRYMATAANEIDLLLAEEAIAATKRLSGEEAGQWRRAGSTLISGRGAPPS